MILNYINKRIRINTLRSLSRTRAAAPSLVNKSSLLHTSVKSMNDDDGSTKTPKDSEPSGQVEQKSATTPAEQRKQMMRNKFAKMNFIPMDSSAPKPQPKTTPTKLTPPVDYEKFSRPKVNDSSNKPPIERKEYRHRPINDDNRGEAGTTRKSMIENQRREEISIFKKKDEIRQESAFKLASLIDKENTEETAKLLLNPFMRKKEESKQTSLAPKETPSTPVVEKSDSGSELRSLLEQVKRDGSEQVTSPKEQSSRSLSVEDFKVQTQSRKQKGSPYQTYQNLKGGSGLSIFNDIKLNNALTKESPIWSMHSEEELKLAQDIPPINGFEEMIKLTDEGKLWKFPIDNQQGMDEHEDAQTPFYEHIFLDHHLERFPSIEPIQQFMTLAINGLSHNGFITLKEKLEIIDWYLNFFTEKLDLIKEALEAERREREFRESLLKDAAS